MPHRLAKQFVEHIYRHPRRLLATTTVLLAVSWGFAGYAFVQSFDVAQQGRINNCIAINELSRKIYVTLYDAGLERHAIRKFIPTENCEDIP